MIYYTDVIDVKTISSDPATGAITIDNTYIDVPCRVETNNKTILNKDGIEEEANYLIMCNETCILGDVLMSDLKIGDIIKVKSVMGIITINAKEYNIKEGPMKVGAFQIGQVEMYV